MARIHGSVVVLVALLAGLSVPCSAPGQEADQPYDLIIRSGRIVDGSGNPWHSGDVAIRDGRIARIGRLEGATATRALDARGLVVAPGFVDIHMHVSTALPERPDARNLIADGVTSIVSGNCGDSKVDLQEWFAGLEESGVALNVASLIGHNTVRRAVMGSDKRAPTPEEMQEMEALVAKAMEDGAVGFSTGLTYVPGTYAETDEIVALARVAARYGGIYATHMRNEGEKVFEAIEESLTVARAAGLPLEISHFKQLNKLHWGESPQMLERIELARAEGIDVTLDQYPYTASSTRLGRMLPSSALAGGAEAMKRRLADPQQRRKIADEMLRRTREVRGYEHLDYAVVAEAKWDPSLEGKSLREINRLWDREDTLEAEVETTLDLMEKGFVRMVYHRMNEDDVVRIMRHPLTMVARDGGVPAYGEGKPHPRSYGAATRVLGRYMREKKILSLEEAVRKLTSLPAQRVGFQDRGLLREGMWADIVIFNPETIGDAATFEEPHQYSHGIHAVLVNGELVLDDGQPTTVRPGQILRHRPAQ
jgi:N-acyl-D-amino-acid deacylase